MRAVRTNKNRTGLHEYIVIRFVDEPRVIATQISVNRRLNTSEKFGRPFVDCPFGTFWTIETNEEILSRIKKEFWDVDDIRIEGVKI